ncbi:hypothetical protein ABIB81_009182, partial [Bradyrhizobium sp. I1.7.5]
GVLAANSTTLESFETSFHQDLNGDGAIGIPSGVAGTAIESYGSTSLVQVASNYFFNPIAGGTGPEFSYGGSPVTQGQFAWSLTGVEAITGGYEVAWKSGAQFTVWYTDSNGNYTTNAGVLAANSTTLTSFETSFHQDLNGDGVVGPPAASVRPNSLTENFSFAEISTAMYSAESETLRELASSALREQLALSHEVFTSPYETNAAHDPHGSYFADSHQGDFVIR